MMRVLMLVGALALASCSTATEIKRPDGRQELLVACGASTPWSVCYKEANDRCPQGYDTISEKGGLNRKEMRIACAPKS